MDLKQRIDAINRDLQESGSAFRTEDGISIIGYFGNLTFLRRTFPSVEALEEAAMKCKLRRMQHEEI